MVPTREGSENPILFFCMTTCTVLRDPFTVLRHLIYIMQLVASFAMIFQISVCIVEPNECSLQKIRNCIIVNWNTRLVWAEPRACHAPSTTAVCCFSRQVPSSVMPRLPILPAIRSSRLARHKPRPNLVLAAVPARPPAKHCKHKSSRREISFKPAAIGLELPLPPLQSLKLRTKTEEKEWFFCFTTDRTSSYNGNHFQR